MCGCAGQETPIGVIHAFLKEPRLLAFSLYGMMSSCRGEGDDPHNFAGEFFTSNGGSN